MRIKLRDMSPNKAFDDAVGRSVAVAAGGFLVSGCLHAAGVFDESTFVLSTMEATFFGNLTFLVAFYHRHKTVGWLGTALAVLIPYGANVVWVKGTHISLGYLAAGLFLVGGIALSEVHRKLSGPQPADDIEEVAIMMIGEIDSPITWMDRITWICFTISAVILLALLLR
jgi:hypothetical protein